ncbi:inhibin beta B chain-like [Lineus longissimus]|uniref:inhibin beta B chain-like n=1 Tax=Lineus longissimus TaxID=88925 RepID=UPI00315CBC1D
MAAIPIVTLIIAYHTLTSVVSGYHTHKRNCTGTDCVNRLLHRPKLTLQQQKTLRIEMIKGQILSKLRMHAKPNVTKSIPRVAFHKALQKLKMRDPKLRGGRGANEDYYAQISEIVSFSEEAPHNDHNALQFTFSKDEITRGDLDVTSAHLWILLRYKKPKFTRRKPRRVLLTVSKMTQDGRTGEIVASFPVTSKHSRWQKLTIPVEVIQEMFKELNTKIRFLVSCAGCDTEVEPVLVKRKSRRPRSRSRGRRFRPRRKNKLNKRRPFLIIRTHVKKSARHKIEKRHAKCDPEFDSCCKQELYVDFKDLGWDWIITPSGYNAHYCNGVCGVGSTPDMYATRHSTIVSRILKIKPAEERLQPCCSPKSMKPLSLLYFDDKFDIVKADLDGMVVNQCSCS